MDTEDFPTAYPIFHHKEVKSSAGSLIAPGLGPVCLGFTLGTQLQVCEISALLGRMLQGDKPVIIGIKDNSPDLMSLGWGKS